MKIRSICSVIAVILYLSTGASAAENTDVSHGRISKMVPAKKEIYVTTDTGKKEFYFKSNTTVEKSGTKLTYEDLREGMEVTVTANKVGKRLDPVKVEIVGDSEQTL
jgi:hypothetical protein